MPGGVGGQRRKPLPTRLDKGMILDEKVQSTGIFVDKRNVLDGKVQRTVIFGVPGM
jgi:hypothetical protein